MAKIQLLLSLLKESVGKCYLYDKFLIDRSMEQASVARIYYYMQDALIQDVRFARLKQYSLDNEYNKKGERTKKTLRCKNGTRPDIILHKRRCNENNMLVVEIKPRKAHVKKYEATGENMDYVKLQDFTDNSIYCYFLGVYVKLNKKKPQYKYFQNGIERQEAELNN